MHGNHLAVFMSYWINETADRKAQTSRDEADEIKLEIGRRDNSGELVWITDFPISEESDAFDYAHKVATTFECNLIVTEEP